MDITVDQMYRIEEKGHAMGFEKRFMMENAGAAAVRRLAGQLGDLGSRAVLILAGLGNNGGDGLVMARHLAGRGARVTAVLLGAPSEIKTEECRWNWSLLEKMPSVRLLFATAGSGAPALVVAGGAVYAWSTSLLSADDDASSSSSSSSQQLIQDATDPEPDVIVDAILGTGISGEIREPYASAIRYVSGAKDCYRLAVDVPSGLDPQTGDAADVVSECDMTVTFHRMKQGIPRRGDLTGTVHVEKIGIPPEAEEGIVT